MKFDEIPCIIGSILNGVLPVMRPLVLACLFLSSTLVFSQSPPNQRPIQHSDYEIWNTASGVTLSPDGQWLIYTQTPPDSDGSIIVKSLTGSAMYTVPTGSRSSSTNSNAGEETTLPAVPAAPPVGAISGGPQFTPDGKRVLFSILPTRAEQAKARAEKKEAKAVVGVMDLATGQLVERIERLKSFNVVEKANYAIFHREVRKADPSLAAAVVGGIAILPSTTAATPGTPQGSPQGGVPNRRGPGTRGGNPQGPGVRPGAPTSPGAIPSAAPSEATGSELIVRNLADGREHVFKDVQDYTTSRDGKLLILHRVSKTETENGLFAAELGSTSLQTIHSAKGKFSRWTWDDKQTRLAFFHEEPAAETKPGEPRPIAKPRVMVWDRATKSPAVELLSASTAGLTPGTMIVERGGIRFSEDGLKLIVGTAKIPEDRTAGIATNSPMAPTSPTVPTAERVDLDLWHWKDELIQPMQKVRNDSLRNRSFSAVYFFDTKQFRQLSDENLSVSVPDFGDWALSSNDKPYKYLTGYGPTLNDYALINIRTGETKSFLTAYEGFVAGSPKGRFRAVFDGKDWLCLTVPEAKSINLTAKLPVKFFNEQFDMPMKPSAYGLVGWSNDEKYLLVADRYDIWKLATDGSTAENLTKIGRRSSLKFDLITFPDPEIPDRGIDLKKPMFLKATNLSTRDTGFFRMETGGEPKMLVMGSREYGRPTKAKNAELYLFTVSTFLDYPDYYVADPSFREVRRVTDINPRKREFNWGKSELVKFKSSDGVELSGVLIKPENFDPQKKYPMIVYIYERLSDQLHRFVLPRAGTSINPTYYASNGYLVFMPDIAYTVGMPGQSAMKCVLPAIQAVVDQGYVNESAIGIQGHSWGGYQIAYMVTQTNRFKAAASGAPVSNMVSAYGGIRWGTGLPREFQYERTQSRIGATLWEAPMKYIENSPIFMADRVKTPLMILHNDQDDAVPWYQGIEYYLALRRLGKECYLFNYNGELHGLRKKATQRDYTLRMQQFFDHHLKGAPMPDWMARGIPFAEREKEKDQWKNLFKSESKSESK